MQSEKAVEVDRALSCTKRLAESDGTRNRDARPEIVIRFFSVRHDDIQSVRRTALKEANQGFALRHGCEVHTERGTTEKAGREPQCYECESTRFYKYSALHIASCVTGPGTRPSRVPGRLSVVLQKVAARDQYGA